MILVVFAMAVLGVYGAVYEMEHGGGCFLTTVAGMTCVGDIAASLNMHFNALRAFSLAVFAASLAIMLSIVFAYVLRGCILLRNPRVVVVFLERLTPNYKLQTVLRWLSHLEHSPSFI